MPLVHVRTNSVEPGLLPRPSTRVSPGYVGAVLCVGVLVAFSLFGILRDWEARESRNLAANLTREQVERLRVSMLRSMEVLHSIVSLHAVRGTIEREQFRLFVQQALERQPELQALSWNPFVRSHERAGLEAAAAFEGHSMFRFREAGASGELEPARERPEYVPVLHIEPLDANRAALGYDLASDVSRRRSVESARDTGCATATSPIRLAQGPENQAGFLVLLPTYFGPPPTTIAERRARLAGFAVAVFRVQDLVGEAFGELRKKGISASLFDESPAGERIHGEMLPSGSSAVAWLDVAGRRWAVAFTPNREFRASPTRIQSWLVLFAGLAFAGLMAAYLANGARRTRQVTTANAALQAEIVERQRAEASAAAANRAKSDFLASMSHEIRTPLNAILGYAQLMQRDPRLPSEQRDATAGIHSSGQHLLGLIDEILDLSKIEAGRMELQPTDFDLGTLTRGLAATFRPLCAQKRLNLRLDLDPTALRWVHGDEGKLRQVLINLLGNALKFTESGEVALCVSLAKSSEPAPDGPVNPPASQVTFSVIDTGLGIPEEEQDRIFQPFHQGSGARHRGGTGLGLAIAQRQVELLGGRLELQSVRGIGSRFFFTLPLPVASDGGPDPLPQVTRLAPGQRFCALVVDDRSDNREVLQGILSAMGVDVVLAESGELAIERSRQHRPDIIFLDLIMPGLSGTETATRLLQDPECGQPRIIMHSASALDEHRREALAAGCADFIAKPFHWDRLQRCLVENLGATFESAPVARDSEAPPAESPPRVALSSALCARLALAAELHSTTALKAGLQELRLHSPAGAELAEHIRWLMRSYDMDGIQRLLNSVAIPVNSAELQ